LLARCRPAVDAEKTAKMLADLQRRCVDAIPEQRPLFAEIAAALAAA